MLKTILSISGKPGLYRLLSSGKNTLIVESLQTKKRIPVLPKDRVVSLGDISMFTDGEDIALSEVLTRLHEKQAGVAVSEELLKDSDALRNSFGEVIPNFDRERVLRLGHQEALHLVQHPHRGRYHGLCRPGRS